MGLMTTPTPLTPQRMERLAFARLLHHEGIEQSRRAAPLNKICILTFHDAVEHFLILACEHTGADQPREFMKYWHEMAKVNTPLSGKIGMDRLNRCRRDFKHTGAPPSDEDIEYARNDTASFFEENTQRVFGIDYSKIDMADLVVQDDARMTLKRASDEAAQGNMIKAMGLLVEALDFLFWPVQHPNGGGPFDFGPTIQRHGFHPSSDVERAFLHLKNDKGYGRLTYPDKQVARNLGHTIDAAAAMQKALRVMAIGVEYQKYVRFQDLTPTVRYDLVEEHRYSTYPFYSPTRSEFEYCQSFVIEVALQIAKIQSEAAKPSWMPDAMWWGSGR